MKESEKIVVGDKVYYMKESDYGKLHEYKRSHGQECDMEIKDFLDRIKNPDSRWEKWVQEIINDSGFKEYVRAKEEEILYWYRYHFGADLSKSKEYKLYITYMGDRFIGFTRNNRWLYAINGKIIGKQGKRFKVEELNISTSSCSFNDICLSLRHGKDLRTL